MDRLEREHFMQLALVEARKAFSSGEVPVGAVIIYQGKEIARAHNLVEKLGTVTAHAELLAIEQASKALNSWRLAGAHLFVTLEPCPMCMGAVLLSRLKSLNFGCFEKKFGAAGSIFDLSSNVNLPREVEVFSGILQKECSQLMQDFFVERR